MQWIVNDFVKLKGADLNMYTYNSIHSNEKVYTFKSAPFMFIRDFIVLVKLIYLKL